MLIIIHLMIITSSSSYRKWNIWYYPKVIAFQIMKYGCYYIVLMLWNQLSLLLAILLFLILKSYQTIIMNLLILDYFHWMMLFILRISFLILLVILITYLLFIHRKIIYLVVYNTVCTIKRIIHHISNV